MKTDILIVGTGCSGLYCALNLPKDKKITIITKKKAEEMQQLLNNFDIHARVIKREKEYMLYLKEGEEISNFLAFIGANNSVLKFEEIRVLREMKNNKIRKLVFLLFPLINFLLIIRKYYLQLLLL